MCTFERARRRSEGALRLRRVGAIARFNYVGNFASLSPQSAVRFASVGCSALRILSSLPSFLCTDHIWTVSWLIRTSMRCCSSLSRALPSKMVRCFSVLRISGLLVVSGLLTRLELIAAAPAARKFGATPIAVSRTLTIGNGSFYVPAEPVASLPHAPLVAEILPFTIFTSNGTVTESTLKKTLQKWEQSDDVFDTSFLQGEVASP